MELSCVTNNQELANRHDACVHQLQKSDLKPNNQILPGILALTIVCNVFLIGYACLGQQGREHSEANVAPLCPMLLASTRYWCLALLLFGILRSLRLHLRPLLLLIRRLLLRRTVALRLCCAFFGFTAVPVASSDTWARNLLAPPILTIRLLANRDGGTTICVACDTQSTP